MGTKMWGKSQFWGIGSEFDPDWLYDEEQIRLRDALIELCRTKIRPLAIKSDKTYAFPRESLCAMAELGLIGLIVPKELGGLGQSHVCAAMIVETLARYGCPSTALIYAMHLGVTAMLLFRYHDSKEIQSIFRRMNSEVLIGAAAFSDPSTGSHAWYSLSAKSQKIDEDHYRVFKFNAWTTSAGFADIYIFSTPTPDIERDPSNMSFFFAYEDEVRASKDTWSALGLHGNQSGPLVFEEVLHKSRMIGKPEDGHKIFNEVSELLHLWVSCVSNGIAMACLDTTKKHTKQKTHGDLGMRVCDYPIIQDYVGGCISETNNCRAFALMMASQLDKITNNNDWTLHSNPDFWPRSNYGLWCMQIKHNSSENVSRVSDRMLKACGIDGYKTELGLERLFRDSKAGCLMPITNEIVRNLLGKGSLIGLQELDMWDKISNQQKVHHEVNKMTLEEKKELLRSIAEDVKIEESSKPVNHPYQDTDFENPFSTAPPKRVKAYKTTDGTEHNPGLNPSEWSPLKLISRKVLNSAMMSFVFALPKPTDHSGCLPGQYIQVRILSREKFHKRFFSPVSPPNHFGSLELVLKFETHGIVSRFFETLEIGNSVDFRGPCGGFEYEPGQMEELTVIASGLGVTPGLQMVRSMVLNPKEKMKITLIYYAKDVEEILYKEELEEISSKDPRVRLILTVGEAPDDWENEVGFVDFEMLNKNVTKLHGVKHKIVMCGGPAMAISCLHALRSLKFPSNMIFIYRQFGTEHMRMVYGRNVRLSGHRCGNDV